MNKIIIYGSIYGTTKMYAEELAKETKISIIPFKNLDDINNYDTIIYFGALYAGGVLGLAKTFKKLKDIKDKKIIIATVGLADPTEKINITNIRNNLKVQLSKEILNNAKIFHLRGGIDYKKLGFAHKTMMSLLYKKTKHMKEEKMTPEDKAIIATYNKKVNFVDLNKLNDIIKEIEVEN